MAQRWAGTMNMSSSPITQPKVAAGAVLIACEYAIASFCPFC
jgi:hypothetical protein